MNSGLLIPSKGLARNNRKLVRSQLPALLATALAAEAAQSPSEALQVHVQRGELCAAPLRGTPRCSERGEGTGAALLRAFAPHRRAAPESGHNCSSGPPTTLHAFPRRAASRGECRRGEGSSGDTWQLCLGWGSWRRGAVLYFGKQLPHTGDNCLSSSPLSSVLYYKGLWLEKRFCSCAPLARPLSVISPHFGRQLQHPEDVGVRWRFRPTQGLQVIT